MRTAIKTGDSDTMNELLDSAPAAVTGDEGDLPGGVNLNINLSPQQPLPDKKPEMGGDVTGDGEDDIKTLLKALLAKLEGTATGDNADTPDDKDKKDPTGDGEDNEEETTITGDSAYRAEVIIPGIDLSRKVKPTALNVMCWRPQTKHWFARLSVTLISANYLNNRLIWRLTPYLRLQKGETPAAPRAMHNVQAWA